MITYHGQYLDPSSPSSGRKAITELVKELNESYSGTIARKPSGLGD